MKLSITEWVFVSTMGLIVVTITADQIYLYDTPLEAYFWALYSLTWQQWMYTIVSNWMMYTVFSNRHKLRSMTDGYDSRFPATWPRDRTCVLRGDYVVPDPKVPT